MWRIKLLPSPHTFFGDFAGGQTSFFYQYTNQLTHFTQHSVEA